LATQAAQNQAPELTVEEHRQKSEKRKIIAPICTRLARARTQISMIGGASKLAVNVFRSKL
jgi:hypothetical protein